MQYKLYPPGRRGRCWYMLGRKPDGRRFEVSTGETDRASAQAFAADYAAKLASNPLSGARSVTFAGAAQSYLSFRDLRPVDVRWIDKLSAWFADRPLREIMHAHLIEVANELLPGRSPATKNRHIIGPASAVLHYAAKQKWCDHQPFERFPEKRRSTREPATDETMAKLLGATTGHRRLLLAVLYETGLRIGDVIALDESTVDLPGCAIMARVAKTDERIRVNISPAIVALIATTPRKRGNRLFPWSSRWAVYRWLRPLCKSLGVTYTPHMSRHALATDLLRRGVPDKQAAEHGAWADPRSLHRYQHARPEPIAGRSINDLLWENGGQRAAAAKKSAG